MQQLRKLWYDEAGVMNSAELILISTILLLGSIVGLATFRDQIVQELGDLGLAVGQLNQGYSYAEVVVDGAIAAGSHYTDQSDFCEQAPVAGSPPACISVTVGASEESN